MRGDVQPRARTLQRGTACLIAPALAGFLLIGCAHNPYAPKRTGLTAFGQYRHFQPSLVQIARMRANNGSDDPYADYSVTDKDVLNYTDHVASLLSAKLNNAATARQGSSFGQLVLTTLTSLVPAFGWSASAASIMGGGTGFLHGMGQNIDAKGRADAYKTALANIQKAEATFYFKQTGMKFTKDATGKTGVDASSGQPTGGIPSKHHLTPAGETLYYRVTKTLQVLEDALAGKIPDLQDLKDSEGDSSKPSTPPPAST